MNKFTWKSDWFALLCLAVSIVVSIWAYPKLPAQIPSHWNINGVIDGYTTPAGHVWLFLGIITFMYLLFTAIPYLEPRKDNMQKSLGFLHALKNYMLAFFLALYLSITHKAIYGSSIPMDKLIAVGVGLLFIVIGRYLKDIKSNYFMGIRTPWTLHSDVIWKKTHELGSTTFVAAGILFIAGLFLPAPWDFYIPLGGTLIAALAPVIYSYVLFREE